MDRVPLSAGIGAHLNRRQRKPQAGQPLAPGQCADGTAWLPMLRPDGSWAPVCEREVHARLRAGWHPLGWARSVLEQYGLLGRRAVRVGLDTCPSVDVEVWRRANRVPIFRNKINRWLFARTTRDNPNAETVREELYDAMVRWSGKSVDFYLFSGGGVYVGDFDLVKVVRAEKSDAQGFPPFHLSDRLTRSQDLPYGPLPTINAGGKPLVYFEVTFAYRGFLTDLPWPVARIGAAGMTPLDRCPTSTDMMLFEVGQALADAPSEKSLADLLGETAKELSKGAAKFVFWPVALAIGLVGVVAWGRRTTGV